MKKKPPLRVVLDRFDDGMIVVYADEGIEVFDRLLGFDPTPLEQHHTHRYPPVWFASPSECTQKLIDECDGYRPLKIIRRWH